MNADRRPTTSKAAVFTLAERPFAGVAIAHGKPDAKKYHFRNSVGNPNAVVQNLLLAVVAMFEKARVDCLYVYESPRSYFPALPSLAAATEDRGS